MAKQQQSAIQAKKKKVALQIERMLYQAYTTSKQFPPLLSTTECEVNSATFDADRTFWAINDRLDQIQDAGKRFAALCRSTEFMSARVYVNALGYVTQLLKRARLPALKGGEQLRDACAARDALSERLSKLDTDSGMPGASIPPRGSAARDVAAELLELVRHGHQARQRSAWADSAALYGTLMVARLTAEELLTSLGDLDAPPLILQLRTEQREAWKVAVVHWRALREKMQPLCANAAEFERLAPWI
jgi:hypothetical protein